MNHPPYSFSRSRATRYTFTSIGQSKIEKVVDFTPTGVRNIFNIGFGDLLEDNTVDDKANSNNGDIIKVLSTVIQIINDFTSGRFSGAEVFFAGSTIERTRLYARILKTYYASFSKQFNIEGIVKRGDGYEEILF